MITELILSAVIAAFVVAIFGNHIKDFWHWKKYMLRLPQPSGRIPVVGCLPDLCGDRVTFFKTVRRWCTECYPAYVLTAGPYMSLNIVGPDDIESVVAASKHLEKGPMYVFMHHWMGEGLLTSSGSKWQKRRKILTPTFHFSILQKFLNIFNAESENFVKQIEKKISGPYVEVNELISELTLNSIIETSMGYKADWENKEHKRYKDAVLRVTELFNIRLRTPWHYNQFTWYAFSRLGYEEVKLVKIMHQFTDGIIESKVKTFKPFEDKELEEAYTRRNKMAMLDLLLNAKIKDNSIDNVGIRDEVNTFMFEGHDTTASGLSFTLMLLANHKDIQDQIYEEMSQKADLCADQPSYSELQELQYMERCIKESLRMYPPVPFIARVLSEDVVGSTGHLYPRGAIANIHIFDTHRHPDLWSEPDRFDPDRFLPENCRDRHPFAYVPFSAGPRNCIGQRFAMLEIKSALFYILKKYVLEPVDTPETIRLVQDLVLRTAEPIRIKFVPRTQ